MMSEVEAAKDDVWASLVAASKKPSGSIYTRYVNRNAAIPLTYMFWRLGVHPNTISLVSSAVTHTALAMLLVLGVAVPVVLAAYLLLVLGYMLDSCDGQLARVSGKTSKRGEWLDHSLDMVKLLTFNMTLGYLLLAHAMDGTLPMGAVFGAIVLNLLFQPTHFFVISMKDAILGLPKGPAAIAPATGMSGIPAALLRNAADYGLFMPMILLLPWIEAFLYVYLAYGVFYVLMFVSHFLRTYRRSAS
jgi:phosphatidylglycerophosphate synthase